MALESLHVQRPLAHVWFFKTRSPTASSIRRLKIQGRDCDHLSSDGEEDRCNLIRCCFRLRLPAGKHAIQELHMIIALDEFPILQYSLVNRDSGLYSVYNHFGQSDLHPSDDLCSIETLNC